MAGLYYLLNQTDRLSKGFCYAWLFGVGKFGVGVSWVYVALQQYGDVAPPLATFFVMLFVGLLALITGLVGLAMQWPKDRRLDNSMHISRLAGCFYFAVVWVLYELIRTWLFTGFPILDAGYVTVGTWLDGFAPIFGVKGVSFVVAFVAAALVSGWHLLACAGGVLVLCSLAGLLSFTERGEARQIGIAQINISLNEKWSMATSGATFRIYEQLSQRMKAKDLVLWSEAAFVTTRPHLEEAFALVRASTGHRYIAGGYLEAANEQRYNSLLVYGEDSANYRKLRLVPFGERVPLESFLRPLLSGFVEVPHSSLDVSDSNSRSLNVAGLRLAAAICYEASFEFDTRDAVRQSDADAIVVVSEDAWFGDSLAPHQNFEMARMRAREHGRYVIRAANSGISGIVGPDGRLVAKAPQFQRTTLEGTVHTMRGATPFTRYGSLLLAMLLAAGFLTAVVLRGFEKRQVAR